MGRPTEQDIMSALSQVEDPELHRDIVFLGMVQDLRIDGDRVSLKVVLTTPACPLTAMIKESVEKALMAVPGVAAVDLEMGADVKSHRGGGPSGPKPVEGVRNLIAIASNKGGAGESTVAANLAGAPVKRGARAGP